MTIAPSSVFPDDYEQVPDNDLDWYIAGRRPGDILFTVSDTPVIVEETVQFPSGDWAARVRYTGIEYTRGTSDIVSLRDLLTETHDEYMARLRETEWRSQGYWRKARNIDTFPEEAIPSILGVATPEKLARFHESQALAVRTRRVL